MGDLTILKQDDNGEWTVPEQKVVTVRNVWSNGKKIRNYSGQGEQSVWHNPSNGYRKMIAVLIEINDSENGTV